MVILFIFSKDNTIIQSSGGLILLTLQLSVNQHAKKH